MNNQRGYLVAFVAMIMLLIVAACSQTAETPMAPTSAPTATSPPAPTATASPGPTATPVPTVEPGDFERQVTVNDRDRSYLLYVPPGLSSQELVPLVIAFGGFDWTPSGTRSVTDFDDLADEVGFLVAYPQGIGSSWNFTEGAFGDAGDEKVDEFAFVREILSDLDTLASIDPDRIYAVGFDQGGGLAYALACQMSDTFAAIGSVASPMSRDPCEPEEAVSVIHVHGLTDGFVPITGGGPYEAPPVKEGLDRWAQIAGCAGSEVEQPSDVITHTIRTSCQAGIAVELYAIESLAHRWPREDLFPATETIWDFFAAHPKP